MKRIPRRISGMPGTLRMSSNKSRLECILPPLGTDTSCREMNVELTESWLHERGELASQRRHKPPSDPDD
jgi:hypothetical protein